MVWSLENDPLEKESNAIYEYILKQSNNKEFASSVSKFIELRKYLDGKTYSNSEELRQDVLTNGQPLFSESEAQQLFALISKKGGADVQIVDSIVRQWLSFARSWTPAFITNTTDSLTPYIFILKTLEYDPSFGPLVGIALDSMTAILPVIATTIENLSPELIGLVPLPGAGPVGAIIGWMVASIFVFLAMLIHISRDHFGEAFIISFSLIPLVGSSLYNAALTGEKFIKKTAERRDKLIETTRNLVGEGAAETLASIIPDLLAVTPEGLPQPLKIPTLQELKDKALNLASQNGLPTSLDDLKSKAIDLAAQRGLPTSLDDLKSKAIDLASQRGLPTSVDDLKSKAIDLAAQRGLPTSVDDLKSKAIEQVSKRIGGKELSRRKHKRSKWRTQRKLRR